MFNHTCPFCNIQTWALLVAVNLGGSRSQPLSETKFGDSNIQLNATRFSQPEGVKAPLLSIELCSEPPGWKCSQKAYEIGIAWGEQCDATRGCVIKHHPLLPLGQTWSLFIADWCRRGESIQWFLEYTPNEVMSEPKESPDMVQLVANCITKLKQEYLKGEHRVGQQGIAKELPWQSIKDESPTDEHCYHCHIKWVGKHNKGPDYILVPIKGSRV